MKETIGRILGYLLLGMGCFLFSYLSMSFLALDLDMTNWSETRRGVVGAWTLILFALWIFETRR